MSATSLTTLPATITNSQWIYLRHPDGIVGPEHYELRTQTLATELSAGEVLVESHYLSVDPYMRINQSLKPTYNELPHALNTVQSAGVVARVLSSSVPHLAAGDWVEGMIGWQTHARIHHSMLRKLDPAVAPVSTALGVLGMPGRTAWFGLTESGRPHAGEVVVVSGAAGAVGSLVAQFAKRHGCKVLGIAGGAAKCDWLRDNLGLDWAVDYKAHHSAEALSAQIKQLTGGVDVYFDNVGGMVTDAIIPLINRRARIVICGSISQYSGGLDQPELGPRFLHHMLYQRATIQGMLARDYVHRMDEMQRIVGPMVTAGQIVFEETIVQGFELLPATLNSLFTGDHRGKLLVQI
ncbi:NADP-dependent oxidoreductase [Solimicrobium silvestre]|uniref:Putative NADP-dependent oxidoreductase n=1 Tax=Solimicrobium silvestre TaxID=2099400 RepID=A0A2S9H3G1_9BURK|nr:NADP-dependent oxidoreductase [Solimicrobium silvestre]PRC94519.1 putative NADP-dependent oxidoreductase [Solimicrobium silvestre]